MLIKAKKRRPAPHEGPKPGGKAASADAIGMVYSFSALRLWDEPALVRRLKTRLARVKKSVECRLQRQPAYSLARAICAAQRTSSALSPEQAAAFLTPPPCHSRPIESLLQLPAAAPLLRCSALGGRRQHPWAPQDRGSSRCAPLAVVAAARPVVEVRVMRTPVEECIKSPRGHDAS